MLSGADAMQKRWRQNNGYGSEILNGPDIQSRYPKSWVSCRISDRFPNLISGRKSDPSLTKSKRLTSLCACLQVDQRPPNRCRCRSCFKWSGSTPKYLNGEFNKTRLIYSFNPSKSLYWLQQKHVRFGKKSECGKGKRRKMH